MILIDSNLVIYAALPENSHLRDFIRVNAPFASDVSKVEVLGYHDLSASTLKFFNKFFSSAVVLPITSDIVDEAIRLRQLRKLKLGDSLIAATALIHDLDLATNNIRDFKWIDGLTLVDPL